jgi:hypothetical protein
MPRILLARILSALSLLLIPTIGLAQNTSALISEKLDQQVKMQIDGTIPQAIKAITNETGVPIEVSSPVYDLLPWGEQTTINAKIANQTLRGALEAITRKLGLTFEVRDEAVEFKPLPALRRLGRRANVEELEVLDLLARTPLESQDRMSSKQLLALVDARLDALKSPFAVENRVTSEAFDNAIIPVARNATLLSALEAIPQSTDATWYPWGRTLLVRPKVDHMRDLLGKTITVRFNGVDVAQVLSELASRSGVDFSIEPGAVQRIPAESRNVRLVLENASIQQALESLSGFTGLAWSVNDKGVFIWNGSAAGGANREPTLGLLTLDNGMQVVLRESQVPPDLREYIKHKTSQQLAKMREMMQEEGFKPTATQPATQPASAPATRKHDDL